MNETIFTVIVSGLSEDIYPLLVVIQCSCHIARIYLTRSTYPYNRLPPYRVGFGGGYLRLYTTCQVVEKPLVYRYPPGRASGNATRGDRRGSIGSSTS